MKGYLNDSSGAAKALKDDWLHKGDIARMDEDGYLFLVDRKKDLIIRGEENIYPTEAERAINRYPKIREATVIGLSEACWGEVVAPFVVLKEAKSCEGIEIQEFCRARLASYKVQAKVKYLKDLAKNAVARILKNVLRRLDR